MRPPGPRTESQEIAAQLPTLPAPPTPVDVSAVLASEAPPNPVEWAALRASAREIGISRKSKSNLEQDAAIGEAFGDIASLRRDFDSRLPSPVATTGKDAVSITSLVEGIKKTTGSARILLIVGAAFEALRWLAPYLHDFAKGLGK